MFQIFLQKFKLEKYWISSYLICVGTITLLTNVKKLKVCLDQNFFSFDNVIYTQPEGLATVSPLSSILADWFKLPLIRFTPCINFYIRYVHNIIIIWKYEKCINFLDLTIPNE